MTTKLEKVKQAAMDLLFDRPHCYTITSLADENGFIPSLVFQGYKRHFPMTGQGEFAEPWYWGKTYDEAMNVCEKANQDKFGLSPKEAAKIVLSSMF